MFFGNYKRKKTCLCKCLKNHASVPLRTVNMLSGTKHS